MKSKGLIITLIVILIILLAGLIILFINLLNNGFKFNFRFINNVSENLVIDKNYDNLFDEIKISTDAAFVKIVESDTFKLEIYGEKENIIVSDSTNVLDINVKSDKCNFFCINTTLSKVIVYLPSDYDKKITIVNHYGDVKIDSFDNLILDAKLNAGDIKVDSVFDIKAKNNYGDIKIGKVNNYLNLSNDCGDIKLGEINISKDSKIHSSLGNIKIGETNEINIDADTDLGDVKVKNNYRKSDITLKIENNCGDIKVNN